MEYSLDGQQVTQYEEQPFQPAPGISSLQTAPSPGLTFHTAPGIMSTVPAGQAAPVYHQVAPVGLQQADLADTAGHLLNSGRIQHCGAGVTASSTESLSGCNFEKMSLISICMPRSNYTNTPFSEGPD